MQIELFLIPVGKSENELVEMNSFLRSHKILEVRNELVNIENAVFWSFCVKYMDRNFRTSSRKQNKKIDYKNILDEETFKKFCELRNIRKQVASENGVPAYAVFTDKELVELAKLNEITRNSMTSISGIGDKKIERYAVYFISERKTDEKTGKFD